MTTGMQCYVFEFDIISPFPRTYYAVFTQSAYRALWKAVFEKDMDEKERRQ